MFSYNEVIILKLPLKKTCLHVKNSKIVIRL